jgi:hypothetical protein
MLRRADFSLSEEQEAVRNTFRTALERNCPIERVEAAAAADPPGYDEKVWRQLLDMRIVAMGVPEAAGGDGAGLSELVLVAEQQGAFLAPVPLVEAVVSARLLARCGDEWLADVTEGNRLATVALHPQRTGGAQLVPAGAIADGVIGLVGDELVLVPRGEPSSLPSTATRSVCRSPVSRPCRTRWSTWPWPSRERAAWCGRRPGSPTTSPVRPTA